MVCRRYERKELGWHHPSTNVLLVFGEVRSKNKMKVSSLLHVYTLLNRQVTDLPTFMIIQHCVICYY